MISGENWQVVARPARRHGGGTSDAEQLVEQPNESPAARLQTTYGRLVARFTFTERKSGMKHFSMACAVGAILCISSTAFAQNNPPSSSTGLQAGDNAQTTGQSGGTTANPAMSQHKKMKHTKSSATGSKSGMGTATPSGPGAPVTASGSGS